LIVEGCAEPGDEREWRHLLQRSFAAEGLSQAEIARFQEIPIPGYARIGAPRVGQDRTTNECILDTGNREHPKKQLC
jgi:hypothetical protein